MRTAQIKGKVPTEIKLGQTVRDVVTRFTGTVTMIERYLNGCVRYQVTSKVDELGDIKEYYFDSNQLEIVDASILLMPKVKMLP